MTAFLRGVAVVLAVGTALAAARLEPNRTTLTVATHYNHEQIRPLMTCFRQYEQSHPGITVVHRQLSYRDFLQTLFMARISGSPPDIYNLQSLWAAQLVQSDSLAVPPPEVAEFIRQAYLPATVDAVTLDGRAWGIPSEVNVYMLVYNKLLLAKAGHQDPPTTWDELIEVARKVSTVNRQGHQTVAGFAFGSTPPQAVNPFLALLFSKGVSLFSDDRRSTNLTRREAIEVLEGQVRLFNEQGTSGAATPYRFPSGTVGMMIMPNWFKASIRQGLGPRFNETVGVAPIPGGLNWRTLQYGFFWAVDANSPRSSDAWALLTWLNTQQTPGARSCAGEMLIALGALTANRADLAASTAELTDSFMKPFVEALSTGRALPEASVRNAAEVEGILKSYIERAWLGRLTPERALTEADRVIRMILAESEGGQKQ